MHCRTRQRLVFVWKMWMLMFLDKKLLPLNPIQANSKPSAGATSHEKMSWRSPQVDKSVGWGGGKKRTILKWPWTLTDQQTIGLILLTIARVGVVFHILSHHFELQFFEINLMLFCYIACNGSIPAFIGSALVWCTNLWSSVDHCSPILTLL